MSDICVNKLERFEFSDRIQRLKQFYIEKFNFEPKFFVKVPGRVNLIGEHIDYCGYPVLPMAIEQTILLAVASSKDNKIILKNIDSKYPDYSCDINAISSQLSESNGPKWYKYFLCGLKGIFDELPGDFNNAGMTVAVSGNIPAASGLSSSSALVSAAVLASSYINNFSLNKQLLSTIAANCERFIGTQGGGMDQAIAFLAEKGCAQYIEWNPLRATPVKLPVGAVFVIANSLAEANKAATSDFNQRVVECRIACSIIAKHEGLKWRDVDRFATLQNTLDASNSDMIKLVDKHLAKFVYTIDDIISELEISKQDLKTTFLSKNTQHLEQFKLSQRASHVFNETIRVSMFINEASKNDSIPALSELMKKSHNSLEMLYECSHEKLDKLVEISAGLGIGARLTGAGWGGCIVALCNSFESSQNYIDELKKNYYAKLDKIDMDNLENIVFATSPQCGAEIILNE